MLTKLAETTTTDGDKVTLYQTDEAGGPSYGDRIPAQPFDGHRRRYVFSVEGKGASGWGAVGAGVEWRNASNRHDSEPWESDAVPVLDPWADLDTFGDEDDYQPVTIRGAVYRYGFHWKPAHPSSGEAWRIDYSGLDRVNGTMTDAGRKRVHHVLNAARDLFLALPDMERETVRRSLLGAQSRQDAIADKAIKASKALDRKMAQLSGRPWAVDS